VSKQSLSGLSVTDFCREHKLSESSFYKWQSEFRKAPNALFEAYKNGYLVVDAAHRRVRLPKLGILVRKL
tara:strand:- start:4752 stop:4961 length:210 start_codon:yes stop_codon:yes gene_type:complete